ncbi:hypothetical protein TNIN_68171 [Trichonephila inaurata madagascariensis]|uniref:C2H2-type domain-containing protein n=1 Tax=Trichonephila inaurata madagascariensis TaxID=2747483 RepID=A0A8X6XG41_9ARAC|nr:hypothetical protein TNIN_290941 [Trichonephila inaurata madagascariensis]GFY64099.1 hypothetical protein TNIN_68171 [Trichonephila inaurata madagascariensis]
MECSSEILQKYYCDVCKRDCTDSDSYDQHILSSAHLRREKIAKLANIQMSRLYSSSNSVETNSSSKTGKISTPDEMDSINAAKSFEYSSTPNHPPFPNHEASDWQYNDREPQAVENARDEENTDDADYITTEIFETYERHKICVLCGKIFKGPIAFEQHLQGKSHREKFLRHISYPMLYYSVEHNTGAIPKYYCRICKKQCTDRLEYEEHILCNAPLKNKQSADKNAKVNNNKESTMCNSGLITTNSFPNAGEMFPKAEDDNINRGKG